MATAGPTAWLDETLVPLLNRPGKPALDALMLALSSRWLLLPLLAAFAVGLGLRAKSRWWGALALVAAVALGDVVSARVLKPAPLARRGRDHPQSLQTRQ